MKVEEHEEPLESSEQLVRRIREEQDAERVAELLGKLLRQNEATINRLARKISAGAPQLYEDAISEISLELVKAVKSANRLGLERAFNATLYGIALDALDNLKAQNKGSEHFATKVHKYGVEKEFRFVSADVKRQGQDGEPTNSIAEAEPDSTAFEEFEELVENVIGAAAYKEAATLLTNRQRAVVAFKLQGLSDVETAARLKINRDTVASDFEKALLTIEQHFAPRREET